MEPFRYHIYACNNKRSDGAPSCSGRGAEKVIAALRREIADQGLGDEVQVTTCGSLGLCTRGPNMVVYPEGVWYSGVTPDDVAEIVREHFREGHAVDRLRSGKAAAVRSEIEGNKHRMLAALQARDRAGALPPQLQETINGFRASRVLLTAIELDLFSAVGDGADADAIARSLGTDPRATASLLNALVALEMLEKHDGTFTNSAAAARYLVAGAEHDSRAAITHNVHLWRRWSTLTEAVRQGTAVDDDHAREPRDEWTEAFIAAMHKNAALRAPAVARAIDLDGVGRVLDIGGGSGAYSITFAQAQPGLSADILDVPDVAPIAQRHIDEAGVDDRVHTRVGDLHGDDYGAGYDLVFISAICHMLSPDDNRAMLRKAFAALNPGGRLVIQDFILDADKTGPRAGALFALNMLVGTRAGSSYSEEEYAAWLGDAGFQDIHRARLPGPTDLVTARHP